MILINLKYFGSTIIQFVPKPTKCSPVISYNISAPGIQNQSESKLGNFQLFSCSYPSLKCKPKFII